MTMKKSLIAVIAGTVLSTLFACCHLLDTLYDVANSRLPEDAEIFMKPGIVSALSSPALLPISLILFTVIIFAMGIIDQDYPDYPRDRRSIPSGVFGLLTAAAVGYTAIAGLLSIDSTPEQEIEVGVEALEKSGANISPLYWQICMGLGIGTALALAIVSIGFITGSNMLERSPLLMLMPVLWMCMRLVLTFLEMTSSASISERSTEIVMLIVMTLFTLSLGKFLANMGGNTSKWAYIYGGITIMFALSTVVSRVVMTIAGSKAQDGQLAQTCSDIIESYGIAANYGDLAMGIFAVVSLVYISTELREEDENMAFGRRNGNDNGQNMYQQPMNPQGMYQQRPMHPQGMGTQGMYQQRPMRPQGMGPQGMYQQRPMQPQGMGPQGMYQQRPMQPQGMGPQGMYQQRPMQPQGMGPQGMYQQRPMQPQGMGPQGMYQQRPMQPQGMGPQGMYQQRPVQPQGMTTPGMYQQPAQQGMQQNNAFAPADPVQPEEAVHHSAPQHRARQDRRGMPRSAGMRMADSFEVRTYGGPSINNRKKFGGLDSFRDQMLSGESALNVQSEELPPPPPPSMNMSDEEVLPKLERFLGYINRVIANAYSHANMGPEATRAGELILQLEEKLQLECPNLTLRYDPDITPDDFAEKAIRCSIKCGNPAIANHKAHKDTFRDGYGISSCYNILPLGGGSYTLSRIVLPRLAKMAKDRDDFLYNVLPDVCEVLSEYMNSRVKFLVEKSGFFDTDFLVTEGLVARDHFIGMYGIAGLCDCVNCLCADKGYRYGHDREADDLADQIMSIIEKKVNELPALYSEYSGGHFMLHAQAGLATDIGVTSGVRIIVGDEPENLLDHFNHSCRFHRFFTSGCSDIFPVDVTAERNPASLLDIVKGAFAKGDKYCAFYGADGDMVRITGYLVKKSDLEKYDSGEVVLQDNVINGSSNYRLNRLKDRKVRSV